MTLLGSATARWRSMPGLVSCGDAAVIVEADGVQVFAVIDGLGHGPDAEASAQKAAEVVRSSAAESVDTLFSRVHASLSGQRGVVMGLIRVHQGGVFFAGVGNIDIFAPEGVPRPVSLPGIVGTGRYRLRPFALEAKPGQRWVLASDGLKASALTAMLREPAAQTKEALAERLITEAARPSDDACVVVVDFEEAA